MNARFLRVALATILSVGAHCACADETGDEKEAAEAAESPVKAKVAKKEAEYRSWEKAVAAAKASGQPILAFIHFGEEKLSSRVRTNIFQNRDFAKDFLKPNVVYYTYTVQAVKQKQQNARGGNNNKKLQQPPKPDIEGIRASEAIAVKRLIGGAKGGGVFPVVALVKPDEQLVGNVFYEEGPTAFGTFVESLKGLMEKGGFPCTVGPKVEKQIEAEAKKAAKLKK